MRKQLVQTVSNIMDVDKRVVTLLGDIGIYGFRETFDKHPDRIYNIGILEQSMISMAAGLSINGMIPIVHTIAPFLVERAFEQLKLDFGYQNIGGNFISVGASFDYTSLGATHHCPADINILKQIPNMQIIVPGKSSEFDTLFNSCYSNNKPTYYRLSEYENTIDLDIQFGAANVIKTGSRGMVIVVGNMLDTVIEATKNLDVTVLYYTTLMPFDFSTFYKNYNEKIVICEPYYSGGLLYDVVNSGIKARFKCIGIDHKFITNHGTYQEQIKSQGLTAQDINEKIVRFVYE